METNIKSSPAVNDGFVSVAGEKASWHAPVLEQIQVAALTQTATGMTGDGGNGNNNGAVVS
jgi:hypothetical protein